MVLINNCDCTSVYLVQCSQIPMEVKEFVKLLNSIMKSKELSGKKKVWEKFLEKYQLGFGYKNDLELE